MAQRFDNRVQRVIRGVGRLFEKLLDQLKGFFVMVRQAWRAAP